MPDSIVQIWVTFVIGRESLEYGHSLCQCQYTAYVREESRPFRNLELFANTLVYV